MVLFDTAIRFLVFLIFKLFSRKLSFTPCGVLNTDEPLLLVLFPLLICMPIKLSILFIDDFSVFFESWLSECSKFEETEGRGIHLLAEYLIIGSHRIQ